MILEITKEKVLEAASKCDTAKQTLKVLFPEVFSQHDFPDTLSELIEQYGKNIPVKWRGEAIFLRLPNSNTDWMAIALKAALDTQSKYNCLIWHREDGLILREPVKAWI